MSFYLLSKGKYLIFLLMLSCAVPKKTDPLLYPGRSISLGDGGGFTGAERQYRLLDNGQLFYKNSLRDSFRLIKNKSAREAKKWFSAADSLALEKVTSSQPGNSYRFLQFNQGKHENRIVWGSSSPKPGDRVIAFYDRFFNYWINGNE